MRTLIVAVVLVVGAAGLARADQPPSPEAQDFADMVKASPAPPPASAGDASGKLGTASMRTANRAASKILERRMAEERPNELLLLRQASAADVVIVAGVYDRVQDVLAAVKVKHVVIPARLLDELPLMATQTLMVNCPGQVSAKAIKKVRDFVERGGFLVTTDWALLNLTQVAFPNTIQHNGVRTPNDVVSVEMHNEKEPLLAHVRLHKDNPRWWLESASFPIRVLDKKRVRVLMSSPEMAKKYKEGAVAVVFNAGQGKVLHMTSHFFLQQSKLVAQSEKKKGSSVAKEAGLSDKDLAALKASEGLEMDETAAGEINSAYSMQAFSTNVLVSKQQQNEDLLKTYAGRVTRNVTLDAKDKKGAKAGEMKAGYRVQVLSKEGDKVKVRDLFGREGWVPADALK